MVTKETVAPSLLRFLNVLLTTELDMGCGASQPPKGGKERAGKKSGNEEPELNGKVKFLACPSVCEVVHAESKHRYFLIAFAPQTHHGLIIAARNFNTGKILAKEVIDSELQEEKQAQSITLSWNLFFKAISTEIAKANKAGAKYEILPNGNMRLEIKISIAGAQTNKKVDCYVAELTPVETNETNLYRLFMEPIATFYGKKRTDLLDRPDPVKEKQYGECEANAIIKSASIAKCRKTIDDNIPKIVPLREQHKKLAREAFEKRAKLTLMRLMLKENTLRPHILDPPLGSVKGPMDNEQLTFLAHHDEQLYSGDVGHLQYRSAVDSALLTACEDLMAAMKPIQLSEYKMDPPTVPPLPSADSADAAVKAAWTALTSIEAAGFDEFSASKLDEVTQGGGFYLTALYLMHRFGVVGPNAVQRPPSAEWLKIDLPKLKNYLFVMQQLYTRRPHTAKTGTAQSPFHNHLKGIMCLRTLFWMMREGKMQQAMMLKDPAELYTILMAAIVHDCDHPGVNNTFLLQSKSYLATLYLGRSPLERHSVAVALQLAANTQCAIPQSELFRAELLQLVLATDASHHAEVTEKFNRRLQFISDWSRHHDDRMLCSSIMIKATDTFYVFLKGDRYQQWSNKVREEFLRQGDLQKASPALHGHPVQESMDRKKSSATPDENDNWQRGHNTFGYYVVLPVISALASIGPGIGPLKETCASNVSG